MVSPVLGENCWEFFVFQNRFTINALFSFPYRRERGLAAEFKHIICLIEISVVSFSRSIFIFVFLQALKSAEMFLFFLQKSIKTGLLTIRKNDTS